MVVLRSASKSKPTSDNSGNKNGGRKADLSLDDLESFNVEQPVELNNQALDDLGSIKVLCSCLNTNEATGISSDEVIGKILYFLINIFQN